MTTPHLRNILLSALVILAPGAALADVTPEQVWEAMRKQIGPASEITAELSGTADRLTVSNITLRGAANGTETETQFVQPFVFEQIEGGAVSVQFPDRLDITLLLKPEGMPGQEFNYSVSHEGLSIRAFGTPQDVLHELEASGLSFALSQSSDAQGSVGLHMDGYLGAVDGSWRVTDGETPQITSDYAAGSARVTTRIGTSPDEPLLTLDFSFSDLTGASASAAAGLAVMGAPLSMAELGPFKTETHYESAQFSVRGMGAFAQGQMGPGNASLSAEDGQLLYEAANADLRMRGGLTALPLPAEVSLDAAQVSLNMPMIQTDTPRPVALEATLDGLVASDFLWSLVDARGLLPRDPATLFIDMEGAAKWLIDPREAEADFEATGKAPAALEQMTLNALVLSFAGARLTGDGAFTFDNDDLKSFNGFPRPIGALDLTVTGGLPLLDKLARMNLVPQQKAEQLEQLSERFAKPGPGADSLTTRIEITPRGQIKANGLPVQ